MSEATASTLEASLLSPRYILVAAAAGWLLYTVYFAFVGPLSDVPGPLPARFTRLWELLQTRKGHFEETNIELHKRYGPIVRIAPNRYSISEASAVKVLYGHGTKFVKAPFYFAFGSPDSAHSDLFNERDTGIHAAKRRRVASLYSMTNLLSYEKFVDNANNELCYHLSRFAEEQKSFHVPRWMQFYAFDVIGEITVGESFGFMKHGTDHNGILEAIHQGSVYGSRIGLFSELHGWIAGLARVLKLPIPFDLVLGFIHKNIDARRDGHQSSDRNDFLTKLMDLREKDKILELDLVTTMGANIAAGSDTTGISLSTVIYQLLNNPIAAKKLRAEIDQFAASGRISDPVTFQEAQNMPYLQAVIKEALRIHPATGQPMSRIVPAEGAQIAGRFFPGGSNVGTSAWVMHHNTKVFGDDASEFRPERWLGKPEDMSLMEQSFLSFGMGARTCIGKNISLLEMTKLVPQLYRKFDFVAAEPSKAWELDTVWFVKQKYECFVKVR